MRTTQQLSITLPNDMAAAVKAKVRTGEYATESEVIRDGLRALLARDRAVESWLHHQVGPAYEAQWERICDLRTYKNLLLHGQAVA